VQTPYCADADVLVGGGGSMTINNYYQSPLDGHAPGTNVIINENATASANATNNATNNTNTVNTSSNSSAPSHESDTNLCQNSIEPSITIRNQIYVDSVLKEALKYKSDANSSFLFDNVEEECVECPSDDADCTTSKENIEENTPSTPLSEDHCAFQKTLESCLESSDYLKEDQRLERFTHAQKKLSEIDLEKQVVNKIGAMGSFTAYESLLQSLIDKI